MKKDPEGTRLFRILFPGCLSYLYYPYLYIYILHNPTDYATDFTIFANDSGCDSAR